MIVSLELAAMPPLPHTPDRWCVALTMGDLVFTLAQVAAGDLDVAVVGEQATAQLAFGDQLQPGPLEVVGFKTALGGGRSIEEAPEHLPRHPDDALVFADTDAKFDRLPVGVPPRVFGEAEKHGVTRVS